MLNLIKMNGFKIGGSDKFWFIFLIMTAIGFLCFIGLVMVAVIYLVNHISIS